jgi:heme/copper-type cytochrome/quinol oxidase subunit 2
MAQTGQGSTRDAVRWGLLLAAVAVSGYRLPGTFRSFQQWRGASPVDPSAAELYRTAFTVNVVGIAIILGVAMAVFYFLRPRAMQR